MTPGLTANNQPTTDPMQAISYFDVNAEDNYAFIERWDDLTTGKTKYKGSYTPPINTGSTFITDAPMLLDDKNFIPQLVQTINTSARKCSNRH